MSLHRRATLIVLTALIAVLRGTAAPPLREEQAPRGVCVPAEVASEKPPFDPAQSAGIFVGVRQFLLDGTLREVPYAVDDAIDLAHLLAIGLDPALIPPARVHLALSGAPQKPESDRRLKDLVTAGARRSEATLADLEYWLEKQAQAVKPGGLLVVSFATHGLVVRGAQYLLTSSSLDRLVAKTSLSTRRLATLLSRSPAARRLVLLDACREPRMAGSPSSRGAAVGMFLDAFSKAEGQAILLARPGETLYDDPERKQGVFTAAVLDGLRCAAKTDHRGFVTVDTLAAYVNRSVAEWSERHPLGRLPEGEFGIQQELGGSVGQLPLARCSESKPLN